MTVTVTTTPAAADATSYASVDEFKAWADQRLKVYTGKTDDMIGAALNAATEYMDARFTFVGYRLDAVQALEWPRQNAWNSRGDKVEGIPQVVKDACMAYAFRALSMELMPDMVRDESGRVVKSKDEKVGPISSSVEYETVGGYDMPIFPSTDKLLYRHGLVCRKGGNGISVGLVGRG